MLGFAWRELARRWARATLNVLGIAVAIALLVSVTTISYSVITATDKPLKSTGADLVIQKHGKPWPWRQVKLPEKIQAIPAEKVKAVSKVPGVEEAVGALEIWVFNFNRGKPILEAENITVTGVDTHDTMLGPLKPKGEYCCAAHSGRFLIPGDAGKHVAVLDSKFASVRKLKVGDTIELAGVPFKIVGIAQPDVAARTGAAEVYIPLDVAQQMLEVGNVVSNIYVKASPTADRKKLTKALERIVGKGAVVLDDTTMAAELAGLVAARQVSSVMFLLVLLVVVLLVGKSAAGSVTERGREIGIMKAVGWTSSEIARLITLEFVLEGLMGGLVGLGVGLLIGWQWVLRTHLRLPTYLAPFSACSTAKPELGLELSYLVQAWVPALALGVAVVLGAVVGGLAAYQAAKANPAAALRRF